MHLFTTGRAGSRDLPAQFSKARNHDHHARSALTAPKPRCASDDKRGVALVEFALLAPTAFLLLMGLVVGGILIANQNLLTDAVRDTARAAAVCGGSNRNPSTNFPPPPGSSTPTSCATSGTTSAWANLNTYTALREGVLAGGGSLSAPSATGHANCEVLPNGSALVCLFDKSDTAVSSLVNNPIDDCQQGYKIEISGQVAQPLYLPLIGRFLGTAGGNTQTLSADAVAVCEQ